MESYTKEQLILAMEKYYQQVEDNPSNFNSERLTPKEDAVLCIEHLITLID